VEIIEEVSGGQFAAETCRHEKPEHGYQGAGEQARGEPILPSSWFAGARN
jgi:hypothetical protein